MQALYDRSAIHDPTNLRLNPWTASDSRACRDDGWLGCIAVQPLDSAAPRFAMSAPVAVAPCADPLRPGPFAWHRIEQTCFLVRGAFCLRCLPALCRVSPHLLTHPSRSLTDSICNSWNSHAYVFILSTFFPPDPMSQFLLNRKPSHRFVRRTKRKC